VLITKIGLGTEVFGGANAYHRRHHDQQRQALHHQCQRLGLAPSAATVVNSGGYLDIVNLSIAEPLTLTGRGQPIQVSNGLPGAMYTGALQGSGARPAR